MVVFDIIDLLLVAGTFFGESSNFGSTVQSLCLFPAEHAALVK